MVSVVVVYSDPRVWLVLLLFIHNELVFNKGREG